VQRGRNRTRLAGFPVSGEQCRAGSRDRRTPTVPFTLRDQAFDPGEARNPADRRGYEHAMESSFVRAELADQAPYSQSPTRTMPMSGCSGLATMTAWATLTVACRAASLAGFLCLAYQAGQRLQASLSQLTNRILCPSCPQDRRCRGGGEADEFQGVQR
jgi:hypothetical protein